MTQRVERSFRDPQSACKLDVDALLAARLAEPDPPAFLADVTVATELPSVAPPGRLLVVRSGRWVEYQSPITAVNLLRLVAWDPDPDACWDLASWVHARLLVFPGDEDIHSYRYDSGPARGKDPDFSDSPIAAFAIRARMRPAIV